jgi:DNA repair protein RadC
VEKEDWQKKGEGHRARLRERFLENGLESFTSTEVLELLLSFGTPRADCKEPARDLLKQFGTFSKVIEAPLSALQEVRGVGPKNGFALHFVRAVASFYLKERLTGKRYLHSSQEVVDYLTHLLRGLKKEVLSVIFLDASHAIIDSAIVAEGTINVNTVYPRELIKKALDFHATALILAHNHPSGSLQPSPQDMKLTKNLFLLCSTMQIQLLDHLIIGDGSFSFADNGLMDTIRRACSELLHSL